MEEKLAPAPAKPEAPVDSMLKDMATIILSTFLLVGWVAFIITYPLVKFSPSPLSTLSCSLTSPPITVSVRATQKQPIHFLSHLKVNICLS
jgi:serine/threonine-protein kinase/endoribonuclease IRE1